MDATKWNVKSILQLNTVFENHRKSLIYNIKITKDIFKVVPENF